jgi:hypothetical protein
MTMDPVQRLLQLCQAVYDAGTSEPGNWDAMQKPLVQMALKILEEIDELQRRKTSDGQANEGQTR